jgi:long-chain acyl-CoA synthetase
MQNFWELFAAAAAKHPNRIAIDVQREAGVESLTYAGLLSNAERVGEWLHARGIGPGDRGAILAENGARWCSAYLALLRVGAVAVPLDTAYKASQVAKLLADSGARVLFTSPRFAATAREARTLAAAEVPILLVYGNDREWPSMDDVLAEAAMASSSSALTPCPAGPDDRAVILYTSGTTADPKGVVLTHANLLAERAGAFEVIHADERDCVLGVLPLFHALAQMANLLLPFSIGARVVFLETVNTTELLRALSEREVTIFTCVPQFFYLIHQRVQQELGRMPAPIRAAFRLLVRLNGELRRVGVNAGPLFFGRVHRVLGGRMRILITGGSRFEPSIGGDLYRLGFNILQAYGLTETSGAATLLRPGDPQIDSVGQALPGNEIRILPREPGEDASDGEVLVRGPVVMQEYFNRPDATAAALRDGWLYTGDLGTLDSAGRLRITGRKKEIIVLASGKNIYPEEIEAHYRQSAFIKELCVIGLSDPSEPSAERLHAVVVPDPDVLRERRIVNAGEIVRFEMEGLSVGLPAHKRVLGYDVWMEPLPRTTTGKLKRFEIERRVRSGEHARAAAPDAGLSEADQEWSERPDVAPVLAVIQKAAHRGVLARPDANLELDLGLDSMERVELLTELEARFAATIPEHDAQQIFTVRELVAAVERHGAGSETAAADNAWSTILQGDRLDADGLEWLLQPRPIAAPLLFGVLRLATYLSRMFVRVEVTGAPRLPSAGAFLICPNHQSYIDPFVVAGVLPYRVFRDLFFVGATEYFENAFTRWFARLNHVVPVDPDASLVPAMQAGAFGLRHGKILMLFPEGERSIDGTVRAFKKGAAILATETGVPLVPVALDGLFAIWPRNRSIAWSRLRPWRRARIAVSFGEPIAPQPAVVGSDAFGAAAEPVYAALTRRLRDRVTEMCGAESRPG